MRRRVLLKRLIDFVASGGAAHPFKLTLQDVVLCQLWLDGQGHQRVQSETTQRVGARLDRWIAAPDEPDLNTAGRRHQHLIRLLIQRLEGGALAKIAADEVAFFCAAHELVERSRSGKMQARFLSLAAPYREVMLARREEVAPSNDAHQLEQYIQYASEKDILAAGVSAVRLLAGIELPCRGPVFKAGNNLRVLGDIPEGCTVVVENEGFCSVDGYVMGRVLARNYCEVRHNISGVAVVLRGHVRARGIINNAQVISKLGSVYCHNAQGPKLVFAVAQSTMLGRFVTRDMAVGGDVRGSHIEVAGTAQAAHYRHLGMNGVTVVLRRELSCEDYGEVTGDELKQLLSRAYALRRYAHNFQNLETAARREADHTAQSILMYLFGGGEVQKRLQGFLHAQRRHTLVSNVVDNLQGILEQAQDSLMGAVAGEDEPALPRPEDGGDTEGEGDHELRGARAEAEKLERSLRARNLNQMQRTLLLEEARLKLAEMLALQRQTAEKMREEERSIQHLEQYEKVLAGSGEGATKLAVLNNILPALQKQPPESPIGTRLRANFVTRALRTVERAAARAEQFSAKAEENLLDFRAVSERLGKDYQIRVLEDPESEGESARVTGMFEEGTRIFMDTCVENMAEAPGDTILTRESDKGIQTYVRPNARSRFHTSDRS